MRNLPDRPPDREPSAPPTIPFPAPQPPRPLFWLSATLRLGSRVATALVRVWMPGATSRCRLCTHCTAYSGVCLVLIDDVIPAAELPTYSTHGLRYVGPTLAPGHRG